MSNSDSESNRGGRQRRAFLWDCPYCGERLVELRVTDRNTPEHLQQCKAYQAYLDSLGVDPFAGLGDDDDVA